MVAWLILLLLALSVSSSQLVYRIEYSVNAPLVGFNQEEIPTYKFPVGSLLKVYWKICVDEESTFDPQNRVGKMEFVLLNSEKEFVAYITQQEFKWPKKGLCSDEYVFEIPGTLTAELKPGTYYVNASFVETGLPENVTVENPGIIAQIDFGPRVVKGKVDVTLTKFASLITMASGFALLAYALLSKFVK